MEKFDFKVGKKFKVTNNKSMYMIKLGELGEIVEAVLVDTSDPALHVKVSNGNISEWAYPETLSPLSNLSFADLVGGISNGSIKHGEKFEQIGGAHYELEVLNGSLVCSLSKGTILTSKETLEAEYVLVEDEKVEPKFTYIMDKDLFDIVSNEELFEVPDSAEPILNVNPYNLKDFEVSRYVGNWKTEFTNEEFASLELPYKFVKLLDKVEVK